MKSTLDQLSLFDGDVTSGIGASLLGNEQATSPNGTDLARVRGLVYAPSFIDEEEQAFVISQIDMAPWIVDLARRVQHYGYRYDYKARRVDPGMYVGELPEWMSQLARRLYEAGYIDVIPDQAIVNEYEPGQGITPHVDCEPCFGDTVISLSMLSTCVMDFTKLGSTERVSILLEPRSIVVLKADARFGWKHGIAKRLADTVDGIVYKRGRRVSLTFRKVILAHN
jgi:alkylated DNA repair dioxygenase AlkB